MKILIGHNHYQQYGGEDAVAQAEAELLKNHGHEVLYVELSNKDFSRLSFPGKVSNILSWAWSQQAYELIKIKCIEFKPDIAHFHNTFFMMTPSVYAACKDQGVPVVQTLHNFRLICSNALLYRQGSICEDCLKNSLFQGIKYACYRRSRVLTWAVVRMLEENRRRGTWKENVDLYIALTQFARNKFIEGGLPADKIIVKHNALTNDPGIRQGQGKYFVFAGRLSEEKGIKIALESFKNLPQEKLFVLGEGSLRGACEEFVKKHKLDNIKFLGQVQKEEYYSILKKAKALIFPSLWYEHFPMVILEAYACGIPVIASRLGSIEEIVINNTTGRLFNPRDWRDLKDKAIELSRNSELAFQWGNNARRMFEQNYTSGSNYQKLMSLYESVLKL